MHDVIASNIANFAVHESRVTIITSLPFSYSSARFISLLILCALLSILRGTHWHSWLRHCATIRMVASSIPVGVTGIIETIGPGIDSASSRNKYQEYFLECKGGRCVGLTTLPPSCSDCLEIWEPQPPGTLRTCSDL